MVIGCREENENCQSCRVQPFGTARRGRISFFVKGSGAIPRIPKGFRLEAQSCPDSSGLLWGSVHQRASTPTGLRLLAPDGQARTSHNPDGVVLFVALLTEGSPDGSGQPWAGRRNPFGIEQNGCAKNEMRRRARQGGFKFGARTAVSALLSRHFLYPP